MSTKQIRYVTFLLTLIFLVFYKGPFWHGAVKIPAVPKASSAVSESQVKVSSTPSVATSSTMPLPDGEFRVARVVDGDTIKLDNGETVRYIGMDTPETKDPRKPVQCFGHEASEYNAGLVAGKIVRLENDVTNRDKYGRLLRYVYVGNVMINEKLVQDGYAHLLTFPPNVKYVARFRAAERVAREGQLGLWSKCK